MQILIPLKVGQRLGAAMGLVLLLTTLISALSLTLSQRLDADLLQVDIRSLPTVRLVHELALLVEGQRGMAALHLLPQPGRDRQALETRLAATRQTILRHIAGYAPRVAGAADRQHFETVQASLALFWATQDRLLTASRLAATEPAATSVSPALAHARSLLTGESQHAFLQLGADLDAWWAFHAQAAHQLAQQAHAAVQQAVVMLTGLCAVALLLGAVAWRLVHQLSRAGPPAPANPAANGAAPGHAAAAQCPGLAAADGPAHAAATAIQAARTGTAALAAAPGAAAAQASAQPASQPSNQPSGQPSNQPSGQPPR